MFGGVPDRSIRTNGHRHGYILKRTTIELDEALTEQALIATAGTLRSTVELGLRMVIAQSRHDEERRQDVFDRHLANAAKSVDFDVLLSGEAWR